VASRLEFRLLGAGGEPVDLWRTLNSHGFVDLPPMRLDQAGHALEVTLPVAGGRPRTVRISNGRVGYGTITSTGPALGGRGAGRVMDGVRHILRLDADLSAFYAIADGDPDLGWATSGAGRMVRSPTVFEDVVKTICTTNCAWSATERMVGAIVEHLGRPAAGARADGPWGRAFPSPVAMAEAGEPFFRDVARAGYRGPYLSSLARSVADGELDLEALGRATPDELPDEVLEQRLLELPGVGPYAAAHIMMTLGRYSRLILDSWSRPTYAKRIGRKAVSDRAIERRFKQYGPFAGLAFWLVLTRDWVEA
jgi:3-methyladenine DNA glycosylase/8-oxoguanine DNA glycosylase